MCMKPRKESLWSLVLLAVFALASCSSSDENKAPEPSKDTGVYRIDLSFSGDTDAVDFAAGFSGTKNKTETAQLFENGKKVELNENGVYAVTELRSYSVQTEDDGDALTVNFGLRQTNQASSVTFTVKGYKDGKLIRERTDALNASDNSIRVSFKVDAKGGDEVAFVE